MLRIAGDLDTMFTNLFVCIHFGFTNYGELYSLDKWREPVEYVFRW